MTSNLRLLVLFFHFVISVTARKGHLAPLGESGIVVALPFDIHGFPNPEVFLKNYVLKSRPLVMRGAALDMPATRLWSDAFMRAKSAAFDQKVAVEFGKKETRKGGSTMKFSEFLQKYNHSDIYYVSSVPTVLNDDVIIPWPLQCKDYERSFEDNVMWFSSGGTKSVIHHDDYENLNCLLRGRKRFLFVNTTKYKSFEENIIDIEDGSYGTVDVERVDLDRYPIFEGMEFFSVDMIAGDCVYSPQLWIHQVQSWGSNIAVNVWWFNEINKLVNISNCNREYDKSMTFNKVAFHKTTEITDSIHPDIVINALRHGISRMVFRASGSKVVDGEKFIEILSDSKEIGSQSADILHGLFSSMDANRNQKLEVADLKFELPEEAAQKLISYGAEWLKEARLNKYPLPVDFSNDGYKTMQPFSWREVEATLNANNNKKEDSEQSSPVHEKPAVIEKDIIEYQQIKETDLDNEVQIPVIEPTLQTSVEEHDEL